MNRLATHPLTTSKSDPILGRLVDELTTQLQGGEPVDLEAFLSAHPDHAESLRRLFPTLEVMAELARSAAHDSLRLMPSGPDSRLETGLLGDYRIVREVGRGGMGVVYEAEQISLGRRVALKVLPFAAALDAKQLQRVKSEAQAAAQLHHTNIVPVFAVGCERVVHYYSMQFIEGQTLAEAIKGLRQLAGIDPVASCVTHVRPELAANVVTQSLTPGQQSGSALALDQSALPSAHTIKVPSAFSTDGSTRGKEYFRTVAKLGVQASEALDFAHAEGVLHRDIKPANLLLDVTGNLWITDFDVARFQNDASLTMTGDLVGTLRYMSPEQALAKRVIVDHRTDVYSLGVTLYELLCLQPAFDGDRQEVMRQIAFAEPKPLQRLNRAIPHELETIVLKAMAKDPAGRYATARELAEDLDQFLDDKPIRAKRPSLFERAGKWSRRHKGVVVSLFLMMAIALVLLSLSTVLIARERDKAQARFRLARRAVDEMYTQVAEKWLSQNDFKPYQREYLKKALGYYQEFAREQSNEPELRYEMALAHFRVGEIDDALEKHEEARATFRTALRISKALASGYPAVPKYRELVDLCNNRLSVRYETARAHYEAGVAHYDQYMFQ